MRSVDGGRGCRSLTSVSAILTLATVATVGGLLTPSHGHADDWLLELSPAALDARPAPGLSVRYPRPGLPAAVAAGETLVVRVAVPAALTPPPGRQQAGALSPWKASLHGLALRASTTEPRSYALHASGLRPDGGSSLVYRLSLPIPAWTAPGTYTLQLSGPGGEQRVDRGVRVLPSGAAVRIAHLPRGQPLLLQTLSALPVDVWIDSRQQPIPPQRTGALQPVLSGALPGVALRVGSEVLTLPACDGDAKAADNATDDATGSALARELGLPRRCLRARGPLADGSYALLGAASAALPSLTVSSDDRLSWHVTPGAAVELDLTLPKSAAGYRVAGGSAHYFVATPPSTAQPRLAARVVRGSADAGPMTMTALRTAGADHRRPIAISIDPQQPRAGGVARLAVRGLAGDASVAWQAGDHHGAFGRDPWAHRLDGSGALQVAAVVVGAGGRLRSTRRQIAVRTARRSGCQLVRAQATGRRGHGVWAALLLALLAWRTSRLGPRRPVSAPTARKIAAT